MSDDIDRELILRAAAFFAAYASEGKAPDRPDPFLAGLMEKALRAKVNGAPPALLVYREQVKHLRAKPGSRRSRQREKAGEEGGDPAVRALLEANKTPHSRVELASIKVLTVFRSENREFSPHEIAEQAGTSNPSDSGSLHGILNRFIKQGLITKTGRGLYQVTAKGLGQ